MGNFFFSSSLLFHLSICCPIPNLLRILPFPWSLIFVFRTPLSHLLHPPWPTKTISPPPRPRASRSARRRLSRNIRSLVCASCLASSRQSRRGAPPFISPDPYSSVIYPVRLLTLTLLTDKDDEALNRWKASLGLNSGTPIGQPGDPKCLIKSLALVVPGRNDVVIDLSSPGAVDTLKDKPFTIKEGSAFHIRASFQVNHEVTSGLKYLQVVKRKGIRVSKDQEMLGSYAPNTTDKPIYIKDCELSIISSLLRLSTDSIVLLQLPRRRPRLACLLVVTTMLSPSSSMTMTTPISSLSGPLTSRRTGKQRICGR